MATAGTVAVRIVADDLRGPRADAADTFARRGWGAVVGLGPGAAGAAACAATTERRSLLAASAATAVGLPIGRTSPDHGTAFAIAGAGRANPGGPARRRPRGGGGCPASAARRVKPPGVSANRGAPPGGIGWGCGVSLL